MNRMVRCLVAVLLGMLLFTGRLLAETVKEVRPDGTLVLDNGRMVALAGIQLDLEGVSVLRVIARNQNLRLREEPGAPRGGLVSVYAYLRAKFLKFSALAAERTHEEEIMLNAFLLEHGAARVAEGSDFAEKDRFLKIQEAARKKGEGVWSYEKP